MRQQLETTLSDDFGAPHSYLVMQHGGREGARLAARVLRVVSGPLGALAGVAVTNGSAEADLSPESLGAAFRSVAVSLAEEGPDSLLDDVFRHTVRDGKRLSGTEFDSAFQGNYGELVEAAVVVLRHNFEASVRRVPFAGSLSTLATASSKKSSGGAPSTGASGA
jgi:hypothetical protein